MAGMIDRIAQTQVVICTPTGEHEDSKPKFAEVNARAFVFERMENPVEYTGSYKLGEFGHLKNGATMLVAPIEGANNQPKLPGKIKVGAKTFEMVALKRIANLRGELLGYKIVVAGG